MDAATRRVKALVTDVRKRWRRRALVQGAALALLALLFCAALLALLYSAFAVPLSYLLVGAGVAAVIVLGLVGWFVVRPAFRRISDRQVALFIEEHVPELEDRLNSAVEAGGQAELQKEHGALLDGLMRDAALRTRSIPMATVIDRKRERLLTAGAVASLALFLLFAYAERDRFLPLFSGADLAALMEKKPLLTVAPGNVEIEKGTSQEIIATLREDDDRDVTLHYKEGGGDWQKVTMQKGLGDPVFLHELQSIQEPVRYFVEYDGERTSPATISLYEFPDVEGIDLTYTYPAYVGRPPYTEEDTGDIRGLEGSTVALDVQATGDIERAELVVNGTRTIPLEPAGDGRFRGWIGLEDLGTYSVRLVDREGKENKFPRAYQIVPVEDERPFITLTDPQRDVRVNAIQEVLIAVTVEDDYGVEAARLKYSVNGAEEETLVLAEPTSVTEIDVLGEHLFFLEDFDLEPGDVISYYVEAEDHRPEGSPEMTDMYFVEVIPFEQQYAQAAAGMPMGGGQPSGTVLSQQQIIAATWKLHREKPDMAEAAFDETLKALVQAQANLKANIEERIGSTAFSLELRSNEANRAVVDLLRQATASMDEALKKLGEAELQEALTPERQALNHLLKADALNKERQVALNQQPGRGGGGSAQEERMTELMDLELDISKDKYEVAPQGQRGGDQQQQAMDDALRKIQELARKQENLANQQRQPNIEGEDKKRRVERLEREQDELREQTEALSQAMRQQMREQQGRQRGQQGQQSQSGQRAMREMDERLERVAENMREAEQALRRGDEQRAQQAQQQALNELGRLEEQLRLAGTEGTRQQIDELAQNFRQLQEEEEELTQDLEETSEAQAQSGRADPEALERLAEKRQALREALDEIKRQAEAVEERTAREDPEIAAAARNAVQQMRRQALEEKMESQERALEQGWLDRAGRQQEEIARSLERMEESMRTFDGGLPVTEEEQLARALADVRALQEQLDDLKQQQQATSAQQGEGQPGDEQAQNSEGQQAGGEGEPSESQAQASGGGQGEADRDQRAQAARRQSQLQSAQEALERLQERLGGNQAAQGPLRQLQRSLNAVGRADHTGTRIEGESADDYFTEQVYSPLSQLELELARQLGEVAMQKKLYGARRGDVPPAYRDLVERYYEALSKGDR